MKECTYVYVVDEHTCIRPGKEVGTGLNHSNFPTNFVQRTTLKGKGTKGDKSPMYVSYLCLYIYVTEVC